MAARVKKGDRVSVLSGKDAGREGRVIAVFPKKNRVLVEGVNRVKRHERVRPSARGGGQEGGIVTKELAVDLSNVTLICNSCGPTRVGFSVDEDGTKVRICRECKTELV
ncbi:MAG TPA: 50S ribosomal protein L24 [Actinomycetota bacterium]|nr:50S ribosomal protein L24 [Actinomycetota bacterium]